MKDKMEQRPRAHAVEKQIERLTDQSHAVTAAMRFYSETFLSNVDGEE